MKNFEERLARLEQLTQMVRSAQTPLAEAVAGFEEGFKLAQTLEKDLEKMEKRVEILLNPPPPGQLPLPARTPPSTSSATCRKPRKVGGGHLVPDADAQAAKRPLFHFEGVQD